MAWAAAGSRHGQTCSRRGEPCRRLPSPDPRRPQFPADMTRCPGGLTRVGVAEQPQAAIRHGADVGPPDRAERHEGPVPVGPLVGAVPAGFGTDRVARMVASVGFAVRGDRAVDRTFAVPTARSSRHKPHSTRALALGLALPGGLQDRNWTLTCGAKGTRTPGLLDANQTLFQLSYSPRMSPQGYPLPTELDAAVTQVRPSQFLLEQARQTAVGEGLAAGLAGGTVLEGGVGERDLLDGVAAHRAFLAGPAMHPQAALLLALQVGGG